MCAAQSSVWAWCVVSGAPKRTRTAVRRGAATMEARRRDRNAGYIVHSQQMHFSKSYAKCVCRSKHRAFHLIQNTPKRNAKKKTYNNLPPNPTRPSSSRTTTTAAILLLLPSLRTTHSLPTTTHPLPTNHARPARPPPPTPTTRRRQTNRHINNLQHTERRQRRRQPRDGISDDGAELVAVQREHEEGVDVRVEARCVGREGCYGCVGGAGFGGCGAEDCC